MNDVRFLGGHGTSRIEGGRENPYNNTHTADPDLNRRWDGQYPSLWVTDGGGGTFFDIWTPSTFAQAGMLVSNTSTEGRIYQMSSEHHVRYEVQLHNVSNWRIYALQTEEERGEGGFALPLEIDGSSNITVANFHIYRVISTLSAVPLRGEGFQFEGHPLSQHPLLQQQQGLLRQHGLRPDARRAGAPARVRLADAFRQLHPRRVPKRLPPVLAAGAKVEKLAGGFYNISGGAADPAGDFYFVDAHWQRIYRWSAATRQLSTVRDNPLDPVNLAFDKAGNLMVVSYAGAGHRVHVQARVGGSRHHGIERAARRAAARHDRRAAGERLAREPAGARPTLPPVRLARRLDLHSRRTGFRQRRDELGSQIERAAARLRAGDRRAGQDRSISPAKPKLPRGRRRSGPMAA